jgi:hypothetical protein
VGYAILAPSSHNSQPWRFVAHDAVLDVYADVSRGLPVVDPDDRELTVSCGAALENILLALTYFGYAASVALLPAPKDPALLARVSLAGAAECTDADADLFMQIPRRRTNRAAFTDRPVPVTLVAALSAEAEAAGATLTAVTGRERRMLGSLVAEADLAQMGDRRFRRELACWLRSNHGRHADGIRGYGLQLSELSSLAAPVVLRRFDMGAGRAADDQELAESSPLLAVLCTATDDVAGWLAAGRALQRVLLRARGEDVWASFLNQPVEVERLRPVLAQHLGLADEPQLVLRFGYADVAPSPEPRRPVADVFSAW